MPTKAQTDAKKKASEIAESAKKARTKKAATKTAAKPAEKPATKVAEEKVIEQPEVAEETKEAIKSDKIIQEVNNPDNNENKVQVTAEAAEKFQASSDEEDMFLRRHINVPGRRALRKAFAQEEIVGDEFGEIVTEGRQRELEYQVLSDSAKARKPKRLLGRVKGVEPVYGEGNRIISYEAKVSLIMNPDDPQVKALIKEKKEPASIYSVYIPAPMFFFFRKPELFEGPDGMRNLLRAMRNKINAIVEFVVYDISADDNRVIGSRVRAMQLKAYEYYLDPRNKKIVPGTKAYARITEVGVQGVTAEVCGAECFIPNNELSWLRLNAASDEFRVGDSIPVVVKTVEVGKIEVNKREMQYVAITASAKDAQKSPIEKYGADYCDGSFYPGVVTYRLASGLYFVRIDNKIDCTCFPPDFGTPHIGSNCSVVIKGRNDKGLTGSFAYFDD